MVIATYQNRGFEFLGLRFEEKGGFNLISKEGSISFKDLHELGVFLDFFEEVGVRYYRSGAKRVDYGSIMSVYEEISEDSDTVVWYNKRYIVTKRKSLCNIYFVLRKLERKWLIHKAFMDDGTYREHQQIEFLGRYRHP